ncbi:hypothetical protein MUN89_06735 [Halobacillus salinarum]|uniref:DUF2547 family protein n=1 Tax=Halobacillus salinarum TaxID=2932257 RepID=A0ABY4EU17_9BACI|nr:hypothetical protein [Halobacillus salinarum]UOQ45626.1 hypothetical protein MUN89_06735 [Halobacillus salinarum]
MKSLIYRGILTLCYSFLVMVQPAADMEQLPQLDGENIIQANSYPYIVHAAQPTVLSKTNTDHSTSLSFQPLPQHSLLPLEPTAGDYFISDSLGFLHVMKYQANYL